ncbi:MAG: hypothetical protein KIT48_09335 [Pseudolabrys sp.]|nr:hypothetical protein [Pseudolabrys sp.]
MDWEIVVKALDAYVKEARAAAAAAPEESVQRMVRDEVANTLDALCAALHAGLQHS